MLFFISDYVRTVCCHEDPNGGQQCLLLFQMATLGGGLKSRAYLRGQRCDNRLSMGILPHIFRQCFVESIRRVSLSVKSWWMLIRYLLIFLYDITLVAQANRANVN